MSQALETLTKTEICDLMIQAVQQKIATFEKDLSSQVPTMSDANLSYYLKGQNELIQKWRGFLNFLEKKGNQSFQKVEDGALVEISKEKAQCWIYIYKLESELELLSETIKIDDGSLGRLAGNLHGAYKGETIEFMGDGRGVSGLTVKILKVL